MESGTKKQFILIDHTIADVSGHYYEYAVHVLKAAARAGYEPVLATNRRFEPNPADPWKVYPVYKYGFWSSMGGPGKGPGGSLIAAWRRFSFRLRCAFRFSTWGMAWAMRDRFGEFLIRQPIERSSLKTVVVLTPAVLALKVVRFLILLALLPAGLIAALLLPLRHIARIEPVRRYAAALLSDFIGAVQFARYLLEHRNDARRWWRQFRCLRRFASDTANLFGKISAGPGDVVFIPTVSSIELMGLSLFFDRRAPRAGASWHLLFRRDIYRGRRGDYSKQEPELDGLRQNFLNFGRKLAARRVFFHTDTDELTEQYNRLGAVTFSTVPIPHTHRPAERVSGAGPLTVIYVGDARGEKGYHLIPAAIQSLWKDYVETGRVAFSLQSNYNVPQGEPEAVIARSQLEALPGSAVRLFTRPLSSPEYEALLLSGDINLLLYDRSNYYARSSGILVESLGAAMPPLVPAGCWLSRQFLNETHRHLESWRERVTPARTLNGGEMRWRVKGNPELNPRFSGELSVAHIPVFSWIRVPRGATYVLAEFSFRSPGEDIRLGIEELDGDQRTVARHPWRLLEAGSGRRSLALIRLRSGRAASLAFSLASAYPQGYQVVLRDLRVDFFTCSEEERPPLGAVGLSYFHTDEIQPLLRDLIDHYPHYRKTAQQFAPAWREYHNADRLVRELETAAGRPSTELRGAPAEPAPAVVAK